MSPLATLPGGGEAIPDRLAAAVRRRRALDLERRGGGAPDETRCGRRSSLDRSFMIPPMIWRPSTRKTRAAGGSRRRCRRRRASSPGRSRSAASRPRPARSGSAAEDDQRPEEVVPGVHERQQPEHRGGGPHRRQHDVPEDAGACEHPSTRAASISSSGTEQTMYWRIRNTPNAETRDGAITACRWFDPAQVLHLDVERDHAELDRDDQRPDHDQHQHLVAAELQLREREPGERAEDDDRERDRAGDDRRVDQRRPEVDVHLARVEDAGRCCGRAAGPGVSTGGYSATPSCRARRRPPTSRAGRPRRSRRRAGRGT